ncbi:hypothetical protein PIB30_043136 [Stylosanthes scabra]|uniref:MULE transposase domain-containing protein n=1 Tax=Stylosanthes scabra TaxID=79078 RepID=A0ABU6XEM3_9FABA|nr:hypothetical protein [Stylosanthes scabra]
MAAKTRQNALNDIQGTFTEQYKRLANYASELLRSNPGSSIHLKVSRSPDFEQEGLVPAIEEVIQGVDNRFCVRHLYNNFRKRFPGLGLKGMM